jgi:ABC-type glutathione transport system ATPase component
MSTGDVVLDVEDLEVHYGLGRKRRQVLKGVTLSVALGEAVGIVGETGSGKSRRPKRATGVSSAVAVSSSTSSKIRFGVLTLT